jgi:hypothetical protein
MSVEGIMMAPTAPQPVRGVSQPAAGGYRHGVGGSPIVARGEPVYRISGAPRALSEDLDRRKRRYLISMAIRTGCLLGAFVVPSPWRWFLLAGAVFIPMFAVILANAGRERVEAPPTATLFDDRRTLGGSAPRN